MKKKLLIILPLLTSIAMAETVKPKEMHTEDSNPNHIYDHSLPATTTEDRVMSSSAEASAQITIVVTIQVSSEMISGKSGGHATMSFLDKNRMQIDEELAKGEGEHLDTLLTLMELPSNNNSHKRLQKHFDELVHLEHDDFLMRVEELV